MLTRRALFRYLLLTALADLPLQTLSATGSPPAKPAAKPYSAAPLSTTQALPIALFINLTDRDEAKALKSLKKIDKRWHNAYAGLLLEALLFAPSVRVRSSLVSELEAASRLPFEGDINIWYRWLWSIAPGEHPDYGEFKAALYKQIDPRFAEYFANRPKTAIRLDEIRWGGVLRDGIPPLKNPEMIRASEAAYLEDDNIVFGVAIDGDFRAYPKRILAWHEMVKDKVAGRDLNGVYCTLCGSMILYDVTVNGVHHELGTSGFLYRSNKLMYDHATKSLWSTLTGTPVVGPLVGKGIELKPLYVVTTTWKEWKKRHPETLVLSLDTGYRRDYGEGVAYQDYFSNDRLMFGVPKLDPRLANKAEVLALRFADAPKEQVAISAEYLAAHPIYHDRLGQNEFVVLTDPSGANRVYDSRGVAFERWNGEDTVLDHAGLVWKVDEAELAGPDGRRLQRLSAHRAFWFGWYSAYPNTRLVK